MSDFYKMKSQPTVSVPGIATETHIELIWQMGLASLGSNNNELVLPMHMAISLPSASVDNLKLRLSRHIGAPTLAFVDQESQSFRICRAPPLIQTRDSPSSFSSPASSAISQSSATPAPETRPAGKVNSRGGKSAVPRPPNAFILYRKDRHPAIKQANPDFHNNDISRLLGKSWKAEPEAVQAGYRARAECIKHQHAINNPGYQYAPRKPGDKKRRMTKKKLARLQSANSTNDIADHVRTNADDDLLSDLESDGNMQKSSTCANPPAAEDYIESRRSPQVSHLHVNDMGNIEITLPSNNLNIFNEAQAYQNQHGAYATAPFVPGNAHQVTTSTPQYVQNDDAFFNSLIDWNGIADDVAQLKDSNATAEELAELADLELGNSFLSLSDETARAAFHEEIDRTLGFF